jgi:hypothetical protein
MVLTIVQGPDAVPGYTSLFQPIATLGGAFIAALLGSWFGAQTALRRFRRERALDRRLDLYDRMARTLPEVKLNLEFACELEEDPSVDFSDRAPAWAKVMQDYLRLVVLRAELDMYGQPEVVKIMRQLLQRFDEVADKTNGFDQNELPKHVDSVSELLHFIDSAMLIQATTLRSELGIGKLPRES